MGRWWLVLGVLAVLTHRQLPRFSSDLALWQAAAAMHPQAPRPAVNVAAQYIVRNEFQHAQWWMERAKVLADHPARAHERDVVYAVIRRQETWISAFSPVP